MSKTWVKMCGLTRPESIELAVALGVDALGLVFYPASPRAVSVAEVATLVPKNRGKTRTVALFVDPSAAEVEEVLATGRVDLLQFHGGESPAFCASFGSPYIKASGVPSSADSASLERLFKDYAGAELILLDAYDQQEHGGTGRRFDWAQAAALAPEHKKRLVLAGGLDPDNVALAVRSVAPFGVDVSSGIERAKGVKDPVKMRQFIEGVRGA